MVTKDGTAEDGSDDRGGDVFDRGWEKFLSLCHGADGGENEWHEKSHCAPGRSSDEGDEAGGEKDSSGKECERDAIS